MRGQIRELLNAVPAISAETHRGDLRISRYPVVARSVFIEVLRRHGMTSGMLFSGSRKRPVVLVRREIVKFLSLTGMNSFQIADYLQQHNSTVRYSIATVKRKPTVYAPPYDPNAPDESGIWAI